MVVFERYPIVQNTLRMVGAPCLSFWAGFGSLIGRALHGERARRVFNGIMGVLSAACVGFILFD